MTFLDCHDMQATLDSIAGAIARTPDEIASAVRTYDDRTRSEFEDPWKFLPRAILHSLAVTIEDVTFEGTCFFHGTRSMDPGRFKREGILPLPFIADRIWDELYELVSDEVPRDEWDAFRRLIEEGGGGHFAGLYRQKMGWDGGHGPFGELVRDVLVTPIHGVHDYLRTPEIIEDIAIEGSDLLGVDILARFQAESSPCLVKFRTDGYAVGALETALLYTWSMLVEGEVGGTGSCWAFSGDGVPVSADAVLGVEVIEVADDA